MDGYFSRTGTRRNLDALYDAGWMMLLSPKGMMNPLDPRWNGRYAMDNGAWWAFQNDQPFDVAAFEIALRKFGAGARWIVLPDIVMGGIASLEMSKIWLRKLRRRKSLRNATFLIAVQNGMEAKHVSRLIGPNVGIFVGGDTDWKLATMEYWGKLAASKGAYCHVGRVNTGRRIRACKAAGVRSFDGSGVSKFIVTLHALDMERRQMDIAEYLRDAA